MLFAAIGFSSVLAYPYLGLNMEDARLDVDSVGQYVLLVVHIFTATLAIVLGPLQFMAKVRAHRKIHRIIGRVYLLGGVLPAGVTAVPVALLSGRPITQVGLTIAAVLWLVTGFLAYRAVRRRDFTAHREWMMRNYALTFLAVTSRILVPLMLVAQIPFTPGGRDAIRALAPDMTPIGQTLGWIINLIIVEIVIRRAPTRSLRTAAAA
jgi:uncharacterized membrane protein